MPPARACAIALTGLHGHIVAIEAEVAGAGAGAGMTLTGLPETGTRETRDRVRAAILNSGEAWPQGTITVTASPASLPKRGSAFDTAIAVAVLAADGALPPEGLADVIFLAELGLDGRLRPVPGVLAAVTAATGAGFGAVVVAVENAAEAELVLGIRTIPAGSLAEVASWLRGGPFPPRAPHGPGEPPSVGRRIDMSDVLGQPQARRAAEISAAGGHSLFLIGPAGAGKSMIAERLSAILPALEPADAREVTAIHSLAGALPPQAGLITEPPLCVPHHTATMAAILGGGSGMIRPGVASLAHRGVLFLDQAPEFSRSVLDALRQPVETGEVIIARAGVSARFPARFILTLGAAPCPCAATAPGGDCTCTPAARRRYLGRISGPLLDRAIKARLVPASRAGLLRDRNHAESSEAVAARVAAARDRAARRLAGTPWRVNAEIPAAELYRSYPPAAGALAVAEHALDLGQISTREAAAVLRVAWTLADLSGKPRPASADCADALSLLTGNPQRAETGMLDERQPGQQDTPATP
jgi:magnesium chelatase family protein